jgi:DNA primase
MLTQMPEGIYRKLMFEQLEKLGRVDLSGSAAGTPSAMRNSFKTQRKPASNAQVPMSPVRKAITLLLYQPALAKSLEQSWGNQSDSHAILGKLDLPGMDILLEVLEILRASPDLSTSAIIERWRGTPSGNHLAKLISWQPELDEPSALESEFIALMNALKKQSVDLRYDDLQAKLDQGKLNEAEMAEYKILLQNIYDAKSASKHTQ